MNPKPRLPFTFLQILCGLAIATGTGLLVAGGVLYPVVPAGDLSQALASMGRSARSVEFAIGLSAFLKGFGACFLTLGILGLVIPWINVLIAAAKPAPAPPSTSPPAA